MGQQGKSGVRLLSEFWQEKEPVTAQVTEKYHAERSGQMGQNHHFFQASAYKLRYVTKLFRE